MATQVKDSFVDLENHQRILEQQVDNLSASLDEWKQWKSEYTDLRTRLSSLAPTASHIETTRTRKSFHGDLVDEKELRDLFGKNDSRQPQQIVGVLNNRLDYVDKNITTLSRQLKTAAEKLAKAQVIANPDAIDEEGLPITEILEELDDDDNVVSFSLRTPGSTEPQLLEALEKAGIDVAASRQENEKPKSSESDSPNERLTKATTQAIKPSLTPSVPTKDPPLTRPTPKKRKSVTFSDDTKTEDAQRNQRIPVGNRTIEEIMHQATDLNMSIHNPVIPTNESEEDAQLRRDMIEYNLGTMNPVVAELRLEEGNLSDDSSANGTLEDLSEIDDDDDDEDDDDSDGDNGDMWSRSKASIITDTYRNKMMEMQKRLANTAIGKPQHVSSEDDSEPEDSAQLEGIGRITINGVGSAGLKAEPQGAEVSRTSNSTKKGVRFANSLDIAENSQTRPAKAPTTLGPRDSTIEPLSDVRERKPEITTYPSVPTGPEGKTIASTVLERNVSSQPKNPDQLDDTLLEREVAVEYHKARNRMIQKQGGFMKENESPIQPLDEEEGGPKRVSRFRAARLAKS